MDNNKFLGEDDDLIVNPTSRVPVCLCLDVSGSMSSYDAIGQLNKGVAAFYDAVRKDDTAALSCEIAIVTFGSTVKVVEDFETVDKKKNPTFTASGGTPLATAVLKGLDLLEERKAAYKRNGVDYYQPWLVLITDGYPNSGEPISEAQARTKELISNKKLTLWPLAVGGDGNETEYRNVMSFLNGFSPKPKAIHLKDLKFEDFFEFLGKSVSAVSKSQIGDTVKLDTSGMDSWGEI